MTATSRPLAVVTGASSGIGAQFARRYASEGFDLVLVARSGPTLKELADQLEVKHGVTVDVRTADLADASDVASLAAMLENELPRLDHLVNCAGSAPEGDLYRADEGALRQMIDLNVTALTLLTRAAIIRMRAQREGTIINIASGAAYQPTPHMGAYGATKSYVLMFTEAMYEENLDHGLRIFAVAPGDTDTPMNPGSGKGKRTPDQVVDTAWKAMPGRKPSVVDGRQNGILAFASSRLLSRRSRLRSAEKMMRHKA
ncbi:SDR family NAD(P)-dependent oxidoreductase [Rhodococcus sp. IEGM 1381]|uniref:SDR family NAD(P)-dependent oxidoreductase n=1 Tax=Rhodococcus sp. IEGM 1381 TaxID=3047085 RepID=UPI0024B77580|nr:SDR family NAD(P)-dependent oxidoreductase [Rhodococcus sp. IEGM 1381]MDI9894150.1 SDR family NAD(P)-dependent oxidoreductase [Rhodococcus sp. IEGM 1381]